VAGAWYSWFAINGMQGSMVRAVALISSGLWDRRYRIALRAWYRRMIMDLSAYCSLFWSRVYAPAAGAVGAGWWVAYRRSCRVRGLTAGLGGG